MSGRNWINLSPAGVRAALRCIERVQDAVGEPAYPVCSIYAHESGAVYACGTDGHRMHAASVGVVGPLLKRLTHGASLAHLEDQPLPRETEEREDQEASVHAGAQEHDACRPGAFRGARTAPGRSRGFRPNLGR